MFFKINLLGFIARKLKICKTLGPTACLRITRNFRIKNSKITQASNNSKFLIRKSLCLGATNQSLLARVDKSMAGRDAFVMNRTC